MTNNNTDAKIDLTYASSIENVDFAFYDWLDSELNLSCNSKDGFKKVPVIWVTPERAFQVKQNREFRDINGTINLPLITIERTNILKDVKNNGTFFTNLPPKDNRLIISKKINQKKTSEFANADYEKQYGLVQFARPKKNQKVVYQFNSMLLPVYATFTYAISIFTQFQQQMNELLQPFLSRTGSTKYFLIERDGYKYECFIEGNIDSKNNIASMEEEERRYISNITIKVLANLVSDGVNQEDSVIKVFENAVELKLPRESIIIQKPEEPLTKQLAQNNIINAARQVSSNVALKKVFLIGDGNSPTYVVNHGLNTRDMYVSVREATGDFLQVTVGITYDSLDQITIDMGEPVSTDSHVVTIIG